jgi:hypothetical protein
MDLRRVLLLFAVTLLVAAAAASLVSPAEEEEQETGTAPQPPSETAKPAKRGAETVEVKMDASAAMGGREDRPEEESVDPGARVVVTVSVPSPGQVELEGLGRLDSADPGTPAEFDLLADRPGRYEVTFTPVEGSPRAAGTIVVGDDAESGGRESRRGEIRSAPPRA